jgi:hypothetical protein
MPGLGQEPSNGALWAWVQCSGARLAEAVEPWHPAGRGTRGVASAVGRTALTEGGGGVKMWRVWRGAYSPLGSSAP